MAQGGSQEPPLLQHKGGCRKGGGMEGFSEDPAEFGDVRAFLLGAFLYAECKSCGAQGGEDTPHASPSMEPAH